jgi:hypothetical protein
MCNRTVFEAQDYKDALKRAQEFAKGRNALVDISPAADGWEAVVYWT